MSQKTYTAKLRFCRICNAEAHIINYGALSCYSCKTFFRRHASRIQTIRPCRYGGHCKIVLKTRKICILCRMTKCLAVGMTPGLIRKQLPNTKSQLSIESNNKILTLSRQPYRFVPQITPLDLLTNDRSCLTSSEWKLLSNVIHAFDKFSSVPSIRCMLERLNTAGSTNNIDVSQSFDIFASFYTSVESFITSTADFQVLTVAEQRSLFQRNLHSLFSFYGTFMLRDGEVFGDSKNESLLIPLYGYDTIRRVKLTNVKMDLDSTLVKVMHIIFAFSANCYTVNFDVNMETDALLRGTFRLLGSQNMYVEILWKYMVYRYSYMEAALRFASLVKQLLDLITISVGTYTNNIYHKILVDEVVEQAKIALTFNDSNATPLWGGP